MKKTLLVLVLLGTGFTYLPAKALELNDYRISQSDTDTVTIQRSNLGRAQNLARQAAEQANGGLNNYRAEPAMFGDPKKATYVENSDGSWTFTFTGIVPPSTDFTIESVVTVAQDFSKITVDYNGPVRSR